MPPTKDDDSDSWSYVDRDPLRTFRILIAALITAFGLGVAFGYWLHLCAC